MDNGHRTINILRVLPEIKYEADTVSIGKAEETL